MKKSPSTSRITFLFARGSLKLFAGYILLGLGKLIVSTIELSEKMMKKVFLRFLGNFLVSLPFVASSQYLLRGKVTFGVVVLGALLIGLMSAIFERPKDRK